MSIDTQELIAICEQLPETDRAEVADFARFLLSKHDDEAWERTIADPKPRPKLDAFVRAALAEGSEPLDDAAFDRASGDRAVPDREKP
ncbi:MAG: hypothetical protein ACREIT_04670 [Tepidisphaeraceae bacterium]